jgi:hypothetical protein
MTATELDRTVVQKVVKFFALRSDGLTTHRALTEFLAGNSPLQRIPLMWLGGDRVLLIHHALIPPAIKDGLESALMGTTAWQTYQSHRGRYLERRIADLFGRVLPGAQELHDFKYFVPESEAEDGDPSEYRKLAEGDHLFFLDDVAVIVEDKAIPLSARSRAGELNPLRRNLGSAITKGAEQATRLRERILLDRGIRRRGDSWVDLSAVRDIHRSSPALTTSAGSRPRQHNSFKQDFCPPTAFRGLSH